MKIEVEREDDGRWIAEVPDLPGVMTYGKTRDEIIAQAVEQDARVLLTEDDGTLAVYGHHLRKDGKIAFRGVSLRKGFDVAAANEDGQSEMPLES
jgi:hypothetical protein